MNYYEKVMIIDPNLDDSAAQDAVSKIKDVITKNSGEIIKEDNWGRRKLAYELNKQQKGNYFLLLFKAPSATILEIERMCKVLDPIIKFMVVKLTKKKHIEHALAAQTQAAQKSVVREAAKADPVKEETTDVQ